MPILNLYAPGLLMGGGNAPTPPRPLPSSGRIVDDSYSFSDTESDFESFLGIHPDQQQMVGTCEDVEGF